MKLIYFVILHYLAIDETINCISSIKKLNAENSIIKIVVVDNCSPNGSGDELIKKYDEDKNVHVIVNESNLGFARGNNVGYIYAKNNNADYIILINNDTLIKDSDFCNKILDLYNEKNFAVLGPDILSMKDGIHQNPMMCYKLTKKNVRKRICKTKLLLLLSYLGFSSILNKVKKQNKIYNKNYQQEYFVDDNYSYILHGSCLIFSKNYINEFDGLNPDTFMYYEEHILAYECLTRNLKMIYSPLIQIEHYRNVSTNKNNSNIRKKNIFVFSNTIKSLKVLLARIKQK